MKTIKFLFLACSLFCFTGCLDMIEEMSLNKDGSGSYSLTFDMSSIMEDAMMKGMIQQMMEEQEGVDFGGEGMEQDTIIYFKDSPELAELRDEKPEFWDKVQMRTLMSETKKKILISMEFEFASIDDINYFYDNLQKVGENNQMGGGFLPLGSKGLFSLKKKELKRLPVKANTEAINSEELDMARMFLVGGSYKTIYHLPGKAKKSTIPNAVIEGKTVHITTPLLDVMDGKAQLDGSIKFK